MTLLGRLMPGLSCCRYEPDTEWVRRPRPRLPGPMSDLRAQLGDKDLLAGEVLLRLVPA
jgi:hypothetical protein